MTLTQLQYFLEVCRCVSITKAAHNLNISQPSLTVSIKNLEQELGVNLFHRVHQRIYLTNEGNYFYHELEPIISKLDSLTEIMFDMGNNKNLVKIGIPPMMGSFLFPQIFSHFKALNPKIQLEITEYGAIEAQKLILDEVIDMAMLIKESPLHENISFNPILNCNLKACMNPEHPLASRDCIKITDLRDEPMIVFNKGFYVTKVTFDSFAKANLSPNIILETSQINTIKRFIEQNLAVSILIEDCITPQDNCTAVSIEGFSPITIGLGWKKSRYLTSDATKMIKFIGSLYKYPND